MIADLLGISFIIGWGLWQVYSAFQVLILPATWAYRTSYSREAKVQGYAGIAAILLGLAMIIT